MNDELRLLEAVTWPVIFNWAGALVAFACIFLRRRQKNGLPIPTGLLALYFIAQSIHLLVENVAPGTRQLLWSSVASTVLGGWAAANILLTLGIDWPLHIRHRPPLARITKDFIRFIAYAAIVLAVLHAKSALHIASLVTSTAVLTAMIGLAAQTSLSSFFAGAVLQFEKPFSIGDWIQHEGLIGKVTSISWKATRLLTRDQTLIYIPNDQLIAGRLINFSQPDTSYIATLSIGLSYDAPPACVKDLLLKAIGEHPAIPAEPPAEVRVVQFGDFAVQYEMRFPLRDPAIENKVKADLNEKLWYILGRNGITIPYPIRDVRLAHEERERSALRDAALQAALAEQLARVALLAPLSEAERQSLATKCPKVLYATGEAIVRQGESSDTMYLIHQGACEVLVGSDEHRISLLATGDVFGEMGLLTGEPRKATVKTTQDTELLVITKDAFSAILRDNPAIAATLGDLMAPRLAALANAQYRVAELPPAPKTIANRIRTFFKLS